MMAGSARKSSSIRPASASISRPWSGPRSIVIPPTPSCWSWLPMSITPRITFAITANSAPSNAELLKYSRLRIRRPHVAPLSRPIRQVRPHRHHHGRHIALEDDLEALRLDEVPLEVLFEDIHFVARGMRSCSAKRSECFAPRRQPLEIHAGMVFPAHFHVLNILFVVVARHRFISLIEVRLIIPFFEIHQPHAE